MTYRNILFLFVLLASTALINAQSSISSGFASAVGNGGTVCFTIGQMSNSTAESDNGSSAPGVQQPIEISVITKLLELGTSDNIFVYPNPTATNIFIQTSHLANESMEYILFSSDGRILIKGKLLDTNNLIDLSTFTAGSYQLKFIQKDRKSQIFHVIKH